MKILFVGFGNVGRRVAEILFEERRSCSQLDGLDFRIIGIVTRAHGSVFSADGLEMIPLLRSYRSKGRVLTGEPSRSVLDAQGAISQLDFDVLVELTALSIEQHGEPATSHVRLALERGRHVVTANKGPCAFSYRPLKELADRKAVRFLFESVVMDGAPIFNLTRSCLRGCSIQSVSGILNSTTNYILTEMERGRSFDEALRAAQEKGIAEADPRHDVDGWDAATKTAILANVLMGATLTPYDIPRNSIREISVERVKQEIGDGNRLKLVCRVDRWDNGVRTSVELVSLPLDHPFATVSGTGSILQIETDLMAPIRIVQVDPHITDTAYGIIEDLLEIARSDFQGSFL
jgi:homoserine dehydrogenase